MRANRQLFFGAAAAAIAAACGHVYATDDTDVGADGGEDATVDAPAATDATSVDAPSTVTDAGDQDADAGAQLACPAGCAAPVPEGWIGPTTIVAAAPDAGPSACPVTYPSREGDTYQAASDPNDAGCVCPMSETENNCRVRLDMFNNTDCTDASQQDNVPVGTCYSLFFNPGPPNSFRAVGGMVDELAQPVDAATCFQPSQPPATPLIMTTITSCASTGAPTACPSRSDCNALPTPDAPFARVCIHAAGDLPCTSADFPNRFVSYQTIGDGRSCNPCIATPPSPSSCLVIDSFSDASSTCRGTPTQVTQTDGDGGTCYQVASPVFVEIPETSLDCAVDGGGVDGGIQDAGAVTFCCVN